MSFKINQDQQITLNDRFVNQTPRTQKIIMNSWCRDFSDIVFPAINEERFSVLYSDNKFSRPNTPVNFIVGALMLKENNNLNDEELLESICCDIRYQYALHTTHLNEQPVSDRTFSRFRERLYHYELETGKNLLEEEMSQLAEVYSNYMNLNSNVKRMDSLMIASRCKRMSRLEIIYSTTSKAIRLLHRLGKEELISTDLSHYLEEDDYNQVIYYCKGDDATPRLEKVIRLYRIEHLNSKNSNAMKNHYLLTQISDILMQLYLVWNPYIKELNQTIKNTSSGLLESFRQQTVTQEDVSYTLRYTTMYLE